MIMGGAMISASGLSDGFGLSLNALIEFTDRLFSIEIYSRGQGTRTISIVDLLEKVVHEL